MNIDLDLDNYDYVDLLKIFKITNEASSANKTKLERTLQKIKEQFKDQPEIYSFYYKSYKILICIFQLFKNGDIISLENNNQIDYYIDKILDVKSFESFDNLNLCTLIRVYNNPGIPLSSNDILPAHKIFERTGPSTAQVNRGKSVVNILQDAGSPSVPNTYNNPVAPGEINAVKRIIQVQNLNLNSCFRSNYYSSGPCDFQYIIPTEIKNVLSLRLASIEIPNAWYLFSENKKNNFFTIIFKDNTYIITVEDGNYDMDTLTKYLNEKYFYLSSNLNELQYIEFSIDPFNHKTTIKLTALAPVDLTFSIQFIEDNINLNIMNTLGWTLGFRLANYVTMRIIISEGLYDGGGDRYIYFSLNDYQYNTNVLNIIGFDKSIMDENIIAKIPMQNGKLCLTIDNNTNPLSKIRKYNGPVNIRNLHIKILDRFGSIIDLNHMDFSFTIEIEVLYECFNFKNVLG
jgi:hypothetical protein